MNGFTYCEAWPEELKEVERRRYHAACLIRCLEAKLERVEPFSEEFDQTMTQLDQAHQDAREAGYKATGLRLQYLRAQERG